MASAPSPSAAIRKIMASPREVMPSESKSGARAQSLQKRCTMRRIALVALLAFATAVPAQQQQDKKSAAGGRTANLPDFTSLMKQQGPAVVNVITKRDPART